MEFLTWLEGTTLAEWVLYSPWANPILLCMHASGMALVVGCGLMTSLRILGYGSSLPLSLFERLIVFAWAGVALNAVSGLLLFISDGDRYIVNWTFQLKLCFILLAGITTWFLWRTLADETAGSDPTAHAVSLDVEPAATDIDAKAEEAPAVPLARVFSTKVRVIAAVSALFWIGAIIAGRMIAYTLAPGFE